MLKTNNITNEAGTGAPSFPNGLKVGTIELPSASVLLTASTGAVTLDLTHRGVLCISTGNTTIPSGIFAAGDVVTVYNNTVGSLSILQGAGLTLKQAGTTNTGTRALATNGICSIIFVSSSIAVVSGAGVS